jgi:hypothetical protein
MKMGDGGFRPAYNVQFTADTQSQFVVGVGITNSASILALSDSGNELAPSTIECLHPFQRFCRRELRTRGTLNLQLADFLRSLGHCAPMSTPSQ